MNSLDLAFNRLYNNDFAGSHKLLDEFVAAHPEDPLGYAVQGSAYLYSELNRLQVLKRDNLTDDQKISSVKSLAPSPAIRTAFFRATAKAQELGGAILKQDPNDRNALLAMCLAAGSQRDFTALIERKLRISLNYARDSQAYAVRLLKVDPTAYDAYLTTGFTEYLVGHLPQFVKWFLRFDEIEGSKAKGLKNLEIVAKSGHYLKPFAQMLLANFYLRENRPADSERMLRELTQEYPENTNVRAELAKLTRR